MRWRYTARFVCVALGWWCLIVSTARVDAHSGQLGAVARVRVWTFMTGGIDPAVRELPGVHLFDADDLSGNLDEGLAARRNEIPKVEGIVAEEIARLERIVHEERGGAHVAAIRGSVGL